MMRRLAGLLLLGGVGWWLTAPPPRPTSSGNTGGLGESGIPWAPDNDTAPTPDTDAGGVLDFDWLGGFDVTTWQPRGIRNNNPGNIEDTGTNWRGLDSPRNDGRFLRFVDPTYGIRALARVLGTYYRVHGISTVRGVINRWAPSTENDTSSYVEHVAQEIGASPDAPINLESPAVRVPLVAAIIEHENGKQPYSTELIERGVAMA
ncbi:hypothetical protein [Chromohalobacter israelensis]|uniref:hypothetical protein n=1 Tax=Chromohalobacter israelensis TaxID=141390 RepID=UPI00265C42FA|nr:hypothetical protein [Chromohalobacter salexigens]MDO0946630.1 hypothetical protein [Chromohalobacter salexigens]